MKLRAADDFEFIRRRREEIFEDKLPPEAIPSEDSEDLQESPFKAGAASAKGFGCGIFVAPSMDEMSIDGAWQAQQAWAAQQVERINETIRECWRAAVAEFVRDSEWGCIQYRPLLHEKLLTTDTRGTHGKE